MRGVAVALGLLLLVVAAPANAQEYKVGPGDVLDIVVLGEPSATGPFAVGPDGTITLAMGGHVPVAGLTLPQVTDKVLAALKEYIKDPQVVVSLRQAALRREFVYLVGQVGKTGAFEMPAGRTVGELIALAGGYTPGAALTQAMIIRKDATIRVDLEKVLLEGDASANAALESGDLVIVPEVKSRVVVMGQVTKPGSYYLKSGDRLIDVLSAAGFPTKDANITEIGVIRPGAGKPTVTPVDLNKFKNGDTNQNVSLQSGDIIYVPERGKTLGDYFQSILSVLPFVTLFK
jgi:polysaccharide biosynthesis/export protein